MIHFIYTVSRTDSYETCQIYRIKKNIPSRIGSVKYSIGSNKGSESEVFRAVYMRGHVTKATFDSDNGYYSFRMAKSHGIKITEII